MRRLPSIGFICQAHFSFWRRRLRSARFSKLENRREDRQSHWARCCYLSYGLRFSARAHSSAPSIGKISGHFLSETSPAVALKQNDFKVAREQLQRATKMPLVEAQAHELLAVLENKENGRVDLLRLRLPGAARPPHLWIEEKNLQEL